MENTELFCCSLHSFLKWQTLRFKENLGNYWPVHYHRKQRYHNWSTWTKLSPAAGRNLTMDGSKCVWESSSYYRWPCCTCSNNKEDFRLYSHQLTTFHQTVTHSHNKKTDIWSVCYLIFSFKFLFCFWNRTRLKLSFDWDEPNVTS